MDEFQFSLMFLGLFSALIELALFPFSLILHLLSGLFYHPTATV